jgi:hypothetical protein
VNSVSPWLFRLVGNHQTYKSFHEHRSLTLRRRNEKSAQVEHRALEDMLSYDERTARKGQRFKSSTAHSSSPFLPETIQKTAALQHFGEPLMSF